jgi:predicted peroxiredoxin
MISKEIFMAQAETQYIRMLKADQLRKELEDRIKQIREMGFKLIVLGNTVKIT